MSNNQIQRKITKIFKTSNIFDILPVNRWWEKEKMNLDKHDDDEDEDIEENKIKKNEDDSNSESNSEQKQELMLGKNIKKFDTMEHNGVLFPQAYQPHKIKIKLKGENIELKTYSEELATFWAQILDNELSQKEIPRKNFFREFKNAIKNSISSEEYKEKFENSKLEDFDFSPIYEYQQAQKEKQKNRLPEEKLIEKEKKAQLTESLGLAFIDGYAEKISNYMVEPPGIYRRRGDHPGSGKIKKRILPEDVSINVGADDPVPICNLPGHAWNKVINNNESTWLAMYKEEKNTKYVFLAGNSKFKGMNDLKKYEKAKKLKDWIDTIRADYFASMEQKGNTEKQQLGVANYLIDILALRVGNEKGDDEADTVGCCSLRVEHVNVNPDDHERPNDVTFDFLGKDSMRYFNTVELDSRVVGLLRKFIRAKKKEDDLFDMINVNLLFLLIYLWLYLIIF
jgi:DNA topoisomerase-1